MRNQILLGATELFSRYGIKSITMDDIARHLAISKKTIYQYFEDKNALVDAGMEVFLVQNNADMAKLKKESANVIEELAKTGEHLKSKVCNLNPSLMFDMRKYFPHAWKRFMEFKRTYIEQFIADTLEAGVKEGMFRPGINPVILARMRVEQIDMGYNPEIFPLEEFSSLDVQMHFFDHFVYGILTEKGITEYEKFTQTIQSDIKTINH